MKTFKDNAGREWTIEVNVDAVKRVKSLIGVDLLKIIDGELLERLAADPILLCDTVYALCRPAADARGVSDEDFGRAMAGDAVDSATTALLEELVDFFPSARRALLNRALAKIKTLESIAARRAEEILESDRLERAVTAELNRAEKRLDEALAGKPANESAATKSGDSSGNLQESSASAPAL